MATIPSLPQIPRRSLVDSTIDLIRTQIESGQWKIGARIPKEAELAEMLQVGRNTVREAVRVLSHAKVLEVRQGDGTYVRLNVDPAEIMRRVTHASLRDHFELRALLETEAARRAAARRSDDDLPRLDALLDARGERPQDGDLAGFIERDIAFHIAVAQCGDNAALAELYRYFALSLHSSTSAALADRALPEPDLAAHRRLVDAIRDRDEPGAAEAARAIIGPILDALGSVEIPASSDS
ncbi:FadR/GntR family transcriptional regulator [Methylobacterium pseudosasicola]|uniref:DNA-binding transcriptional regulator, FadR family n=1 Tax=Methylobacterium pseudosasicola TaxID=582667 RepID=A0A1I4JWL3_9HYPH|nr:FCD domain-containing protein [Methylobacterium pseudosasicola]SFL70751.1 DNA-binding transcriptional regulator, FadR family [Methylobacterium pseudosasicola]